MTATCKCGVIVTAPPDPLLDDQRTQRAVMALMTKVGQHAQTHHKADCRAALMLGMEFTGLLLAYRLGVTSSDPALTTILTEQQSKLLAAFESQAQPQTGGKTGEA